MTTHGIDVSDMLGVHAAMREQYAALPSRVSHVPSGDAEHADVIADHIDLMSAFLEAHHDGEEAVLWPLLEQRIPEDGVLIDTMGRQHEALMDLNERVFGWSDDWRSNANSASARELCRALNELDRALEEHLSEEERRVLPLARANLTQDEWFAMGEHSRAALSPDQLFTVLGFIHQAEPTIAESIIDEMPLPAQDAWHAMGKPSFIAYAQRLEAASNG